MELITTIISIIVLIVFLIIAANIATIKKEIKGIRKLLKLEADYKGYTQKYKCPECGASYFGKREICPKCGVKFD